MRTDLVVNYQTLRSVCEQGEKNEDLIKGPWQCSGSAYTHLYSGTKCPILLLSLSHCRGKVGLSFHQ